MSKEQRLEDLEQTLRGLLPYPIYLDSLLLLKQFIKVFEIKEKLETEKNWFKRISLYTQGYAILADGYIRDLRVNSTAGRILFPTHHKFGTLTATMKRVKKAGSPADELILAIQVCVVLNDYDPNHC